MPLLFSYGSNHPTQLAERLGHNVVVFPVYAEGYLRVFRGWSRNWNCGVASLKKGRGATYGVASPVTEADLKTLDRFEGVASGKYRRMSVPVRDTDGVKKTAVAYVSTSSEYNPPSQAYLEACAKTVSAGWGHVSPEDFPIR